MRYTWNTTPISTVTSALTTELSAPHPNTDQPCAARTNERIHAYHACGIRAISLKVERAIQNKRSILIEANPTEIPTLGGSDIIKLVSFFNSLIK